MDGNLPRKPLARHEIVPKVLRCGRCPARPVLGRRIYFRTDSSLSRIRPDGPSFAPGNRSLSLVGNRATLRGRCGTDFEFCQAPLAVLVLGDAYILDHRTKEARSRDRLPCCADGGNRCRLVLRSSHFSTLSGDAANSLHWSGVHSGTERRHPLAVLPPFLLGTIRSARGRSDLGSMVLLSKAVELELCRARPRV